MKVLYSFIGNYAGNHDRCHHHHQAAAFPPGIHQQKSTAKMSVFQPLINEIQQKYKNDPQKQQEELMKLQQEHGYNPMGGCMPMLLTMLVLFGFLGVVYYPVHYIFGVSNDAIKAACEAIGLATTNTSTMQTALIQAIHNGASIDPSIISAPACGRDCQLQHHLLRHGYLRYRRLPPDPAGHLPGHRHRHDVRQLLHHPEALRHGCPDAGQHEGHDAGLNLMFVTFCFNAPIGFSFYYSVSNVVQIFESYVTYKIYSPEKFKAQYEAELAAKRAEKKKKRTVTVEQNGKPVPKKYPGRGQQAAPGDGPPARTLQGHCTRIERKRAHPVAN